MNWVVEIAFHWPHDRFALGWEYAKPDETFNYTTIKLYLLIATFTIDF